jgi:hypothetical protein
MDSLQLDECVGLTWLALQDFAARTDESSAQLKANLHQYGTSHQDQHADVQGEDEEDADPRVPCDCRQGDKQQDKPNHQRRNPDPHW